MLGMTFLVTCRSASKESEIRILLPMLSLFLLWLLLSGIYQPLIIGFGLFSTILCTWIISKLDILGSDNSTEQVSILKLLRYLCWLTVEIGKADWAVTKLIISPHLNQQQRLIRVPATQTTDFGKMLFANSITITPGTVTVETETDEFIIHALTDEAADKTALADMGKYVSAVEQ